MSDPSQPLPTSPIPSSAPQQLQVTSLSRSSAAARTCPLIYVNTDSHSEVLEVQFFTTD